MTAIRAGGKSPSAQDAAVRDPCAKHLAMTVLARHELAVSVLVEGVCDQTSRLEACPIYVRIVEVAGSSPVTSTEKPRSDPMTHVYLDRWAPRRDSMCSLAKANRCAALASDSAAAASAE